MVLLLDICINDALVTQNTSMPLINSGHPLGQGVASESFAVRRVRAAKGTLHI
jgi:hypothetical protein